MSRSNAKPAKTRLAGSQRPFLRQAGTARVSYGNESPLLVGPNVNRVLDCVLAGRLEEGTDDLVHLMPAKDVGNLDLLLWKALQADGMVCVVFHGGKLSKWAIFKDIG